ncbi:MAG: hypothetical protein GC162_14280 [Planctomycetes bacterium]|nr:hypothetical protein [Planctomycetota bacterium]
MGLRNWKRMGWCLAFVLAAQIGARADLTTKNATIDDIMLNYRIPCDGPIQSINLGDVAISLSDAGAFSNMSATLTIDAAAQTSDIWHCLQLHWIQTIWHLSATDPAKYKGANPDVPTNGQIIDPPNGGWDYMYTDGSARTMPDPAYNFFIDDQPWYYSAVGEAAMNVNCQSYTIEDGPADRADPEYVGFSTYLVATVTMTCDDDPMPDCLIPGQMIVLGGFDWTTSNTDIFILGTFNGATAGDIAEINLALTNADFTGWEAFDNDTKVICCIPTPAGFAGGFMLLCIAATRRYRAAA